MDLQHQSLLSSTGGSPQSASHVCKLGPKMLRRLLLLISMIIAVLWIVVVIFSTITPIARYPSAITTILQPPLPSETTRTRPLPTPRFYNRTMWGETIIDPFNWFASEADRQKLLDYIAEENRHTDRYFVSNPVMRKVRNEIVERMADIERECKDDFPFKNYWILEKYFYAVSKHNVYYRWPVHPENRHAHSVETELRLYRQQATRQLLDIRIILDLNNTSSGKHCIDSPAPAAVIGAIAISPDENLFAYAIDCSGAELFNIMISNATSVDLVKLPISLSNTSYHLEWTLDGWLIYTKVDDQTGIPSQVWSICIINCAGGRFGFQQKIFHEADSEKTVELEKSASNRYIFIKSVGQIKSDVYVLDAERRRYFKLVVRSTTDTAVYYQANHFKSSFFLLTDLDAPNRRIWHYSDKTNGTFDPASATMLIDEHPERYIETFQVYDGFLVVWGWQNGQSRVSIHPLTSPQNGKPVNLNASKNRIMHAKAHLSDIIPPFYGFRTNFMIFTGSYIMNYSAYEYEMNDGTRRPVNVFCEDYTSMASYEEEQLMYETYDGRRLPAVLAYRKPRPHHAARRKALVIAYGAYGGASYPTPEPYILSLLDRGLVVVYVAVRGDGSLGKRLYEEGKFELKMNSFLDLRRALLWLSADDERGLIVKGRSALFARSAGGLMAGTALNWWGSVGVRPITEPSKLLKGISSYPSRMKSEILKALDRSLPENMIFSTVIARVPFVDVINDMIDSTVAWTAFEWNEWGNPIKNQSIYFAMRDYSPYENIVKQRLPATLIWGGLADNRIPMHESPKFVAKLRWANRVTAETANEPPLLLRMDAYGHFGGSDQLTELATIYGFIIANI